MKNIHVEKQLVFFQQVIVSNYLSYIVIHDWCLRVSTERLEWYVYQNYFALYFAAFFLKSTQLARQLQQRIAFATHSKSVWYTTRS